MTLSAPPTISVIVPVYNGGNAFRRCLESLGRTDPPPDEIIVVSDGATDGSPDVARTFGAQVLSLPVTGGPARARNHGAERAAGGVLLFIDSDVLVPPDTVGKVADLFRQNSELAAVFGSYDDEPGAANFLSQYKNLLHHYVHQTGQEEAVTFWAGCGAVRRDVFLALNGFDESYRHPSIEDIELGYRLKQAGKRILLCKDLQVKHLKRWGARALLKSDLLHRAVPWTELILRHGRLPNDLNLKTSSRASAVLVAGLALALAGTWREPGLLVLAAVLAALLWVLNAPLYRFFHRKRGLRFTLLAVLWHWFYYLYSAAVFAALALRHAVYARLGRAPRPGKAAAPIARS